MATQGVIFDRDGTLTRERGYVLRAADLELLPGALEAVAAARDAGCAVAVATNQSPIARGLLDPAELERMHDQLRHALGLQAIYHCPHGPDDGCECRKPQPGLVLAAVQDLDLDADRSVVVGDNITDLQSAAAAGLRSILVRTGHGVRHEEAAHRLGVPVVKDVETAVGVFLEWSGRAL